MRLLDFKFLIVIIYKKCLNFKNCLSSKNHKKVKICLIIILQVF